LFAEKWCSFETQKYIFHRLLKALIYSTLIARKAKICLSASQKGKENAARKLIIENARRAPSAVVALISRPSDILIFNVAEEMYNGPWAKYF
jgi:hypothetical protein